MLLIVGLGNPGKKYEKTRHNIGFDVIDKLAAEYNINNFKEKFSAKLADININGEKILFLKPTTYMNLSGESIIAAVNFYKINIKEELIVIYDDMDLPLGKMKLKFKGGAGGHNGLKSIISHCGKEFIRVKCGIGKPVDNKQVINYVLNQFPKEEKEIAENTINKARDAVIDIIEGKKLADIMKKYNTY